jgi:hypothetical protein
MATQLQVYNKALVFFGARNLASLAENREARRAFDAIWDETVAWCLEQAVWDFALRGAALTPPSPGSLPPFRYGYDQAYAKPADIVHTFMVADNERFDPQLYDFIEEGDLYYGNPDVLYIRYTSNHASYGLSLTRWTYTFTELVAMTLAAGTAFRLTGDAKLAAVLDELKIANVLNARLINGVISTPGQVPKNALARREMSSGGDEIPPFPFPIGFPRRQQDGQG